MKQKKQTVVMDFTGIYENEKFYKGETEAVGSEKNHSSDLPA